MGQAVPHRLLCLRQHLGGRRSLHPGPRFERGRATFDATEAADQRESGVHSEAEEIATRTQDRSPKPRAGQDVPEPERDRKIREAAETLTKDNPERQPEVEEGIRSRPFTLVLEGWPGSEMFEIDHLGSNAIVKLNMRHPFYREVYHTAVLRFLPSHCEWLDGARPGKAPH